MNPLIRSAAESMLWPGSGAPAKEAYGRQKIMIEIITGAVALAIDAGAVIMIAAFGELLEERAGIFNMGLEGTMAMGAVAAFITVTYLPNPYIGLLAAILVGMLMGAIMGITVVSLKANQVISGLALGFVGNGLARYPGRPLFRFAADSPFCQAEYSRIKRPARGGEDSLQPRSAGVLCVSHSASSDQLSTIPYQARDQLAILWGESCRCRQCWRPDNTHQVLLCLHQRSLCWRCRGVPCLGIRPHMGRKCNGRERLDCRCPGYLLPMATKYSGHGIAPVRDHDIPGFCRPDPGLGGIFQYSCDVPIFEHNCSINHPEFDKQAGQTQDRRIPGWIGRPIFPGKLVKRS